LLLSNFRSARTILLSLLTDRRLHISVLGGEVGRVDIGSATVLTGVFGLFDGGSLESTLGAMGGTATAPESSPSAESLFVLLLSDRVRDNPGVSE
jgi:hypothetical protein